MTNVEYHGGYRARGWTLNRVGPRTGSIRHMILQGPNGEESGLPHPDDLTAEQRDEEFAVWLRRNLLD